MDQDNDIELIDYFAGLAMQCILGKVNRDLTGEEVDHLAKQAYIMAQAMMCERAHRRIGI